jgi:hypothetical protein
LASFGEVGNVIVHCNRRQEAAAAVQKAFASSAAATAVAIFMSAGCIGQLYKLSTVPEQNLAMDTTLICLHHILAAVLTVAVGMGHRNEPFCELYRKLTESI